MALGGGELREVTRSIWSAVLGLTLEEGGSSAPPTCPRSLVGCVRISGRQEIAIVLHVSTGLARQVAAAMLGVAPEEASSEEVQDALAELANMIGGTLKNMVAESGTLSIPSVAEGMHVQMRLPGSRLVSRVALACQGEPLVLSLHEKATR